MTKFTIPTTLLLAAVLSADQSAPRRDQSGRVGQIERSFRAAIERHDVPGVVATAGTKNRIIFEGAFGMADVASARRMSSDAVFSIASMTKAITSVAAMQLVERGKIGLDDPDRKSVV